MLKPQTSLLNYCILQDPKALNQPGFHGSLVVTGVIKLPIFRGIKQCKCMVILGDFPYNSALFWVGKIMTLVSLDLVGEVITAYHISFLTTTNNRAS